MSAAGMGGAIEIAGVSKSFGGVAALRDVSLTIPSGSFFSLLGPSGCGKTTLLRILAGLEAPDSGTIRLDGRDITRLPPEKRPFNIVFQRYALFPHLSVGDNVAFGLTTSRAGRPSAAERDRRVGEALAMVGLSGFAARMPNQISGGQAQRVAVARALIRRPEMLLLDEPLSALDRNVRHAVREELLRIHGELRTTFLLVTHDQEEALSMSEQVALMNGGRIEQVAPPETIYRQPATLFAARFIGAGSFIAGRVESVGEGRATVRIGGLAAPVRDAGVTPGGRAEVLFRPEELTVGEAGGEGLAGEVEVCAFFGAEYEATVRAGDALLRIRAPRALRPGERVGIRWAAGAGIAYPGAGA